MTAGSTFVGQFTDHDITFDQTSLLGVPQNPLTSRNTRTPALDLDSVFGGGPGVRPDLYVDNEDGTVGPRMKIGSGGVHEDLPRGPNEDGSFPAIIADPRNDENLMHRRPALRAHPLLQPRPGRAAAPRPARLPLPQRPTCATATRPSCSPARRRSGTTSGCLVNEHLPQICGQAVVDDVLRRGNRFYSPPAGDGFMPIEFGGAAYRFGHSMVRPSYRANFTSGTGDSSEPAPRPRSSASSSTRTRAARSGDRGDLLGGYPAPRRYIGWQTFFDLGDGQVKPNKKVDATISKVLFDLPLPTIAPHTETAPLVLPQRNLLRHLTWGLPSGQAVARRRCGSRHWAQRRPEGHRRRLQAVRHAAPRSGTTSSPRPRPGANGLNLGPGRRPHRRRDPDRPPARRRRQLPQRPPAVQAVPRRRPEDGLHSEPGSGGGQELHTRPLPLLRGGRGAGVYR